MNEINRAKQDLYISAEWGWKAVIFTGENPSSKLINNHSMRLLACKYQDQLCNTS